MTTVSVEGYKVGYSEEDETFLLQEAVAKIFFPAEDPTFSYDVSSIDEEFGVPHVNIYETTYSISLNGVSLDVISMNYETQFFIAQVEWSAGTSVTLGLYADEFGFGGKSFDYYFFLDGAVPDLNSPADWDALDNSISSVEIAGGEFAPGQMINWTDFKGITVTENDRYFGTYFDDSFEGGRGNDRAFGGRGNDYLGGGAGRDKLFGQSGKDVLVADAGRDRLLGGSGRDTLEGGKGDDFLRGGGGADTFYFSNKDGSDVIADFNADARREKIDLSDVRSIRNFRDLSRNHMEQDGEDIVIDDNRGTTITLLDVDIQDLDRSDFLF